MILLRLEMVIAPSPLWYRAPGLPPDYVIPIYMIVVISSYSDNRRCGSETVYIIQHEDISV